MTISDDTQRFFDAFNELEELLHHQFPRVEKRFGALVDAASRGGGPVAHYRSDLMAFSDLRNVLVHRRTSTRPLAEVHPETATRLEKIVNLIKSPPRVMDHATKNPVTCQRRDQLAGVVATMSEQYLSQVPVVERGRPVDLLTANTIMRWIGAHIDVNGELLAEAATIQDVLHHKEPDEAWTTRAGDTSVTKVLNLFASALERGTPLAALVITSDGKPTSPVQAILTAADLPKLHKALQV